MSDVFISYAREDRDKAECLARACEQQKWVVWWDKVIPPGKKYADVIGHELETAKAVVVLWSRASVASDWVKDEAQEAANRGILIPALIEKVNPPYGFRQVQTADLSEWDGSSTNPELESFVRAIGGLLNRPVSNSVVARPPWSRQSTNASLSGSWSGAGPNSRLRGLPFLFRARRTQ